MTRESITDRAAEFFERHYGHAPASVALSPGRINIIGEHVDYAGGMCLPAAVDRYLAVAAAPASTIRIASELYPGEEIGADVNAIRPTEGWADQCLGTLAELRADGLSVAVELAVVSEIPAGSGLSSSAAIEVASALTFFCRSISANK